MSLFRICYVREGRPAGVTFWAADLVDALAWSDWWEGSIGKKVLTLKQEDPRFRRVRGRLVLINQQGEQA
jgi:hypothetical protein